MEGEETEEETALRETWEEVSIKADIENSFRKETLYTLPNGNEKKVIYYIAHYDNQKPSHNPGFENRKIMVLQFEEAYKALTYNNTKDILREVNTVLTNR